MDVSGKIKVQTRNEFDKNYSIDIKLEESNKVIDG